MILDSRVLLTRIAAPLLMLVILASSSPLHAQFFGGGDQEEMMKKQFSESLKQQKVALENRIKTRIADIDRACQLSDSQKQKLSIASKGAVKSSMDQAKKTITQQAKDMGFDFDPDEEPEEKEDEAEEDRDENVQGAMMAQAFFFDGMMGQSTSQVEDNKVWQSAISKVLNEEQSAKWKNWVEQRAVFQRQIAVASFIAKADRKLLLAPEQRDELTKYVDENYGEELYSQAQIDNPYGSNMFFAGGMMGMQGGSAIEDADEALKKILTETQLSEWMQSFEGMLSNMEGAAGGGFGFGFGAGGGGGGGIVGGGNLVEVEEDEEDKEDEEDE